MTKEEHIIYWLKSAEHDLDSAESMFDSEKYDWCLFVGHLSLEKLLKALFVQNNKNETVPRIHNLVRLAELSGVLLDKEQRFLLDKINDFNIQTRYPDYKLEFYNKCTKDFTSTNFEIIKDFYKWLISLMK